MSKEIEVDTGKFRKGHKLRIDHPIIQKKIKKSLEISKKEGGVAASSISLGQSYLPAFALALNATNSQIGILHAIINFIPGIIQLKASNLMRKFSRKKIVMTSVIIRMILWIPIILTGLLFYLGFNHSTWLLIGLCGTFYAVAAISHPVWFSWMGSLVPENTRGKYFSKRNRVTGLMSIITIITAAIILDAMKKYGQSIGNEIGLTILGFGLLFTMAIITRGYSLKLLKKQYEPRFKLRKKDFFSLKQFLQKCTKTPFGRFTIFRFLLSFAVEIAGPFWAVYMLRNLGMSYLWYMLIIVAGAGFRLIFLPMLGKFSDRFGNIKLMRMTSWLIATIPFIWIISTLMPTNLSTKIFLLFVPQVVSGFAWAGYDLAVNNYVFDSVSSQKRSFGMSYVTLMIGIATFLGAGLGAGLVLLNVKFMETILFVFLISGILRIFVAIFGVKLLHEVRHVKKFSYEFFVKELQPRFFQHRGLHHHEKLVEKNEHYA